MHAHATERTILQLSKPFPDFSLYVITDTGLSRGRPIPLVVEEAVAGGATCVQLREKEASTRELYNLAVKLRKLSRDKGVTFIVNDRVDIALAVKADGVHLGVDDLPLEAARRILPSHMLLGFSPERPEQAVRAQDAGADYLGIGAVYGTGTKPDAGEAIGIESLARVCRTVKIPVVGIGGITAENAREVIRAGAVGVAVVSSVISAPHIPAAARQIAREVKMALSENQGGN